MTGVTYDAVDGDVDSIDSVDAQVAEQARALDASIAEARLMLERQLSGQPKEKVEQIVAAATARLAELKAKNLRDFRNMLEAFGQTQH
jgi:hypothetical protein